ncbi:MULTISPECIES: DegT/DnrJ/EryC1/StrS aminotransferase family protein [unclassified Fibrobacter]|uniref:DegT/DnrJ/EryC1/StrS family aminotransferase n=1 Tax=unclassified Fibrobacter TaxID=2634177 RepID=UPI000D6D7A49|nr:MULTISPECIES: DegT/DnrJ/EryC1/StrS family aminotransferase [unclassified Fibrobacter]PWJ71889.1 UDP-2-acetamido-2-deoxy-ribo-hexuluronate aminotransferase [Fibrobacter sp. UWR4]PZW73803.1 UDP-2-acetamido-2-deoxy-ribo-hexuluronate aminotransferase [Fibrobacter sp. UWR1]
MIPFVNLVGQRDAYRQELEKAEKEVLDSGCFIGGPQVKNLEKELSDFVGRSAISCGSGTDALTITLMAMDLKPGDQVIVPDFTFIAPAESVSFLGGIPKFADIDLKTLQIDTASVQALVNEKTRGIIAVDLFGQCAPFEKLREIAEKNGLWIIEDAAQAFGATRVIDGQVRKACTFGDISITSFYPTKPLGCYGDGGALFTEDPRLEEKIRMIANHGSPGHYDHQILGVNSRLDAVQAAILRVKLKHLDDELKVREANALKYDRFFLDVWNNTSGSDLQVFPQTLDSGNFSTYAQYTLLASNRNAFIQILKQAEIPFCIHYPETLQNQPCFAGLEPSATPNAKKATQMAISLPACAFTDVDQIISRIQAQTKQK